MPDDDDDEWCIIEKRDLLSVMKIIDLDVEWSSGSEI